MTLTTTMMLLKRDDSLIPTISRVDDQAHDDHGGDVEHGVGIPRPALGEDPPHVVALHPGTAVWVYGADVYAAGRSIPMSRRQRDEVPRPAHRHRRGGKEVLEDQVPADDPGDELAHGGVAVGVRRPGDRDHRRELGVAEAGKRAGGPGQEEGIDDGRAGIVGGGLPGEHEDAGADDGADAQHDEAAGAQRALEAVIGLQLGLEGGDILTAE